MFKHFIGITSIAFLSACGSPAPDAALLQPGVSRELAQFRKEHFKEVRYNLFFSISESREEAVTGKADITLAIRERQPVIIDFRGESEQVASVLLNGRKVPYTVKDEHIVIDTREVTNGENRVTIEFTANDQSLNRRDEFLYTLLVPDRARTLFPCFDQPDMKSLFTLSLEVPSSCRLSPMGRSSRWIRLPSPVVGGFISGRQNRSAPIFSLLSPVS
ncbi:MAG: hypothetical protein V8T12_06825 [Parabacteroides johnsonii]